MSDREAMIEKARDWGAKNLYGFKHYDDDGLLMIMADFALEQTASVAAEAVKAERLRLCRLLLLSTIGENIGVVRELMEKEFAAESSAYQQEEK